MLVFLPGKLCGQRSLACYSPWSHRRVRGDLATKQQQKSVSMSIPTSDFIPASLPTLMSMFVPTSVSLISAFQISSSVPFFLDSNVLLDDICFSLSNFTCMTPV